MSFDGDAGAPEDMEVVEICLRERNIRGRSVLGGEGLVCLR